MSIELPAAFNRYHLYTRIISLILILGLIVPSSSNYLPTQPSASEPQPQPSSSARVQPALKNIVAQSPHELIRLIVQKEATATDLNAQITYLGGAVIDDLHIINALSIELPSSAIPQLAATDGVRWISLDAPIKRTSVSEAVDVEPNWTHQVMLPIIGTGSGMISQSPEAEMVSAAKKKKKNAIASSDSTISLSECTLCSDNTYLDTLRATDASALNLTGAGLTVAVIDSGISDSLDFAIDPENDDSSSRILKHIALNGDENITDRIGHGTHVAGIIGGNGHNANGLYAGVAPDVNLISLNISDSNGKATESDAVLALQWILENKDAHNIRVVNMSVNSTVAQSYHHSPLNAAAEILWFNGVVVVVSTGNKDIDNDYNPFLTPPANDPFLITVGASDEKGNSSRSDDKLASFTSYNETQDFHIKPEIIAPGVDIVSVLAPDSQWQQAYPERTSGDSNYFRASGNSMAAPMVTGAIALLLQSEPDLTPDQVKYRLMKTAGKVGKARYLNIYEALTTPTDGSANTGIDASQLLSTGSDPIEWDSVNWDSVNWDSVNWDSVNWDSVNWDSVNWDSVNLE